MALKLTLILLFITFIIQVQSPGIFCFSLCKIRDCSNPPYNKCKSCTKAFNLDNSWSSSQGACIMQPLTNTSTNAKYVPIARTSDITYDFLGPLTPETLQVAGSAATPTFQCRKDANKDYWIYGNLATSANLTIDSLLGVDSSLSFYMLRIRGGVVTLEDVDTTSKLVITFTTNASQPAYNLNIDAGSMDEGENICGGGQKQMYRVFDTQFNYNETGVPYSFLLQVTGNTKPGKWGIMWVVIQARICHTYCLKCYGDSFTSCWQCDYVNDLAKLSGNTCNITCAIGYGNDSSVLDTCIKCQDNCTSCLDYNTTCISCYPGYYLYNDNVTVSCINPCPSHYYATWINSTGYCLICDANCQNCTWNATRCIDCYPGFYLYPADWKCYFPCPLQFYQDNATLTCKACDKYCYTCIGSPTFCTVCDTNGSWVSYLMNNTCLVDCGIKYYEDNNGTNGPNLCQPCNITCLTCDFNSNYCLSCVPGYYLLNNTCNLTCPEPAYFADNATWTCIDCSLACVSMTMDLYFKNNLKQELICDLTFRQDLNWGAIDIQNFIIIDVIDPLITISSFNVVYQAVTPKIMRITLIPKGYIFIYNATFTFTTVSFNGTYHNAANGYPFQDANYGVSKSISWFLIKAPSLSNLQKSIIDGFSKFSQKIVNFTTLPGIQQIKKTGIFAMFLGGAQATSTSCLINTIPSQNFYEGVRLWAAFVFYDVPPWEQNSKKSKLLIVPEADGVVKDARLLQNKQNIRTLFDKSKMEWRFQRTGHTSFFIFDTYMNIFLMLICWILVIIGNKCIKHKIQNKRYMAMFYSFLHKAHEISIFYISLSTLLEWMYFDAASGQRWVSFILCLVFNVYFLAYQLYIYYDMIHYPSAEIGNKQYDYYCMRYGSLLKNIRFIEYDKTQPWTVKHWFRPYNFHILSYYKKFLMMIALPIFYGTLYTQTYCLCFIQLLQIIRFIVTWPFKSKARNIIRLILEIIFLLFLASIIIQTMMVKQITLSDPNTLQTSVDMFYKAGWAGFVAVFIFNVSYLAIFIYDCVMGCRKSNVEMMDEARRFYYMQRLNTYQKQNQDVPIGMINRWVKLGNLNDRKYDELPDINLRVQYFRILKSNNGYEIQLKKLGEVYMNIQFNYQKENNITAGQKINKRFTLTKSLSPQFFYLIDTLYKKYSQMMLFENMIIKTFQRVPQSQFKPGDRVELDPKLMMQKLELETYNGQKKSIKLQKLLEGFPIPYNDIKQFL